jgi:hypothetical protein
MPETQVLFLHHIDGRNDEVVSANLDSFRKCGNEVQPIHDADVRGLPNSIPVRVDGKIPRGSRWAGTDSVFLNYVLDNRDRLRHERYILCEYDCHCECNVNLYCEPYRHLDVCAPFVVTKKNDPGWGWFQSLNLDCELVGFRPAVFLLFSREAILSVAEKYVEVWNRISGSNCEARLGSVASLLGLKIGQFKDLHFRASWGPTRFQRNMSLYHPVKIPVSENTFLPHSETTNFAGVWEFGRSGSPRMGILVFQTDGTILNHYNYNESYWHESGDTISIYSGRGGLTSRFKNVVGDGRVCVGDYYHGDIHEEKMHTEGHHWIRRIKL